MLESGITDFRLAKSKAVERLGLGNRAPLPRNADIEAALATRNRLFHAGAQPAHLHRLRMAAAAVMQHLEEFRPRLVGPVLSGHATEHSSIDLHVFTDTAEHLGDCLSGLSIPCKSIQLTHRWRRGEHQKLPGYRFEYADCEVLASVFSLRLRGHAPLSPVDGKPMQRAAIAEVNGLIEAGSFSAY